MASAGARLANSPPSRVRRRQGARRRSPSLAAVSDPGAYLGGTPMPADAPRVYELFAAALELTDPAERQAFLDRECGGDVELRQEVEKRLWNQTLRSEERRG